MRSSNNIHGMAERISSVVRQRSSEGRSHLCRFFEFGGRTSPTCSLYSANGGKGDVSCDNPFPGVFASHFIALKLTISTADL